MPANRFVGESHDGSLVRPRKIEQKADEESDVALAGHPKVISCVRRHPSQRLANLRGACGHEYVLPCGGSVSVLVAFQKEGDQEQFKPISQRSRERDLVQEAHKVAGYAAGEIHERSVETPVTLATWGQEASPFLKMRKGVLRGYCTAMNAVRRISV